MTNHTPVQYQPRGLKIAVLLALLSGLSTFVSAAPATTVVAIEPTRVADLVLLRGGFDAGLRQGMICTLTRGTAAIAEVLVVDVRPAHSAALILNVTPQQSIRSGDLAAITLVKT